MVDSPTALNFSKTFDDFHHPCIQSTLSVPSSIRLRSALPGAATLSHDDSDGSHDFAPPDIRRLRVNAGRARVVDASRNDSMDFRPATQPPYLNALKQQRHRGLKNSAPYLDEHSSVDSAYLCDQRSISQDSFALSSTTTLPPLQNSGPVDSVHRMQPLLEDDPANFDLVAAPQEQVDNTYQLDAHAEQLLSREHLDAIFADRKSLLKFTGFLNDFRPRSVPILVFYLDALKALRAIKYANAIAEALDPIAGFDFTNTPPRATRNEELQKKADQAFDQMVLEDLPAYITHTWISIVSTSIQRRITGTLAPHLREASEGLAEVFCLTDPSREDNPIVFASEEFHRTTQYGMNYSIGRNCRFLQGPKTNPHSIRRLAAACKEPREHSEVYVNYRRDGSPFINLLMTAPLFDSQGTLRYFIGAQVDVSGLLKEMTGMKAFADMLERKAQEKKTGQEDEQDEFQSLSEMFNNTELDTVRQFGGSMHREQIDDERQNTTTHRPRLVLNDPSSEHLDRPPKSHNSPSSHRLAENGKLQGVYQHYLLIRPAPSLRILFTSPSLRVPGILQSPFLSRIGGSSRVRNSLEQAFTQGRGVTAKIRWLTRIAEEGVQEEGRSRWIHCTPLLGHGGSVGVWMIVLVDDDEGGSTRRVRNAPPVSRVIGGKEFDSRGVREREENKERTRLEPVAGGSERDGGGSAPSSSSRAWRRLSGLDGLEAEDAPYQQFR
jgi:PAS domain-containing protein